ncbi:MAG: cystathionine beta-lyase [Alphaproteobacteria bacterium]|nr:MAG: cystathionine beta-lyase [Alphaproteobacteria bacterium]
MTHKKDSELVHLGRRKAWTGGAVNPPVYHASTILFDTVEELRNAYKAPHETMAYGRRGTPTTFALAEALAKLEGGAGAVIYPSGLAAVTTAILSFVAAGDHMLMIDTVYEPTRTFCDQMLSKFGVEVEYFDPLIGGDIAALIRDNTSVVFVESPGSVTMEVADVPAIVKAAHDAGSLVLMDNTWATPLYFEALGHGVDVSIHALTKYVVGHSDAMLGAAIANDRAITRLRAHSGHIGQCAGPDDIYLGLRGLRTLSVRLARHQQSALEIAAWLKERDEVARVLHPALPDCPGHELWKRDFHGASGLFSIILKHDDKDAETAFLEGMTHFKMGFSWGGFESLVMAYRGIKNCRTATRWHAEGTVIRLHVGLEDVDDLKADLDAAFARYRAAL